MAEERWCHLHGANQTSFSPCKFAGEGYFRHVITRAGLRLSGDDCADADLITKSSDKLAMDLEEDASVHMPANLPLCGVGIDWNKLTLMSKFRDA